MAEQEVIKHTKKIYKVWNSKEHSFWAKVKEFVLEILIIVFAVSLSIWLHGQSEHAHQQKEVKEFLLGLQADLKQDSAEMEADKATYLSSGKTFRYIRSLKLHEPLNVDSVNIHRDFLFNATMLIPNSGRFEGFKSAGKIGTIENKALQNEILNFYQEDIPFLILLTDFYNGGKRRLKSYFDDHLKRTSPTGDNFMEVLASEKVYNEAKELSEIKAVINQYTKCIAKINEINRLIDQEYKK